MCHPAIKNDSSAILGFFEIASVFVRLDHVACVIGHAKHGSMWSAAVFGVSNCVRDSISLGIPQATEWIVRAWPFGIWHHGFEPSSDSLIYVSPLIGLKRWSLHAVWNGERSGVIVGIVADPSVSLRLIRRTIHLALSAIARGDNREPRMRVTSSKTRSTVISCMQRLLRQMDCRLL